MTKRGMTVGWCVLGLALSAAAPAWAQDQAATTERTFRLSEGVTLFVLNPDGRAFTVSLDVRDLNLLANGPRETLFKVYDPDGVPVVREIIPDDGCGGANFPDRTGGWDHELQYYANLYVKGTLPLFRWSAGPSPERLKTLVARTFDRPIQGGRKACTGSCWRARRTSTSACVCRRTCGWASRATRRSCRATATCSRRRSSTCRRGPAGSSSPSPSRICRAPGGSS